MSIINKIKKIKLSRLSIDVEKLKEKKIAAVRSQDWEKASILRNEEWKLYRFMIIRKLLNIQIENHQIENNTLGNFYDILSKFVNDRGDIEIIKLIDDFMNEDFLFIYWMTFLTASLGKEPRNDKLFNKLKNGAIRLGFDTKGKEETRKIFQLTNKQIEILLRKYKIEKLLETM